MITQLDRTLAYLKEHKVANGNELRSALRIVDVPKCISLLVKQGYPITSQRKRDGTCNYYLGELPQPKPTKDEDWDFTGPYPVLKGLKQGRIF
jgi:biotin operon repressor